MPDDRDRESAVRGRSTSTIPRVHRNLIVLSTSQCSSSLGGTITFPAVQHEAPTGPLSYSACVPCRCSAAVSTCKGHDCDLLACISSAPRNFVCTATSTSHLLTHDTQRVNLHRKRACLLSSPGCPNRPKHSSIGSHSHPRGDSRTRGRKHRKVGATPKIRFTGVRRYQLSASRCHAKDRGILSILHRSSRE